MAQPILTVLSILPMPLIWLFPFHQFQQFYQLFSFFSILSQNIINSISTLNSIDSINCLGAWCQFQCCHITEPNRTNRRMYTTGKKIHDCQSWQLQQLSRSVIPPICFVSFHFIVFFPLSSGSNSSVKSICVTNSIGLIRSIDMVNIIFQYFPCHYSMNSISSVNSTTSSPSIPFSL